MTDGRAVGEKIMIGKRLFGTVYSLVLLILLAAGEIALVCVIAWQEGIPALACAVAGFLLSVIFTPMFHELGHVFFGKKQGMRLKMTKFFCFKISETEGKLRFSFSSPFLPEETQMIPRSGGNMRRRALCYTAGGLIGGGVWLIVLLAAALICGIFSRVAAFVFWSGIPYAVYLFLLNSVPAIYTGGKTDAAIFRGILKGDAPEKAMVCAMEIYGQLSEGKSFAEIPDEWYFGFPQLAENEPMYAMMLDLRYRRYLENGETEKAADCLNRLGALAEPGYLYPEQLADLALEFVYMHILNGDLKSAEESMKLGELTGKDRKNTAAYCRVNALRCASEGKNEEADCWKSAAEEFLRQEPLEGMRKSERLLLSRIACSAQKTGAEEGAEKTSSVGADGGEERNTEEKPPAGQTGN